MPESLPMLAFSLGSIGPWEMMILLVLALLIFGKRLPEVGKSLGKGIVEFKKGLKGVEDEIESSDEPRQPATPRQIAKDGSATVGTPSGEPAAVDRK